jgi:pimeloyl-ACP methyl ester carboxylesterase
MYREIHRQNDDVFVNSSLNKVCKVSYLESGDRRKEDLILVHGLYPGGSERYMDLIPRLAKEYHVVAPDFLGFGYSEKPETIHYESSLFVSLLEEFMKSRGMSSANIVGSSFGGQVAADFAAGNSKKVRKLVLVAPTGLMPTPTKEAQKYYFLLCEPDEEGAREYLEKTSGGRKVDDEMVKGFVRMAKESSYAIRSTAYEGIRWNISGTFEDKIRKIESPTLIMWGEDDKVVPVEYSWKFAELIPNSRVKILKRKHHVPYAQDPDVFSKEVLDFLRN